MSYTITTYNGQTTLATVADGTVNTQYDITLIGKSYAGYGQYLNENFVYLTQNFANPTSPPSPLTGQIWYDTTNNKLKFYDASSTWHTVGTTVTSNDTSPSNLAIGDLWWDTSNQQLYAWNGTSSTLIGGSPTVGSTQSVPSSAPDVIGGSHAVLQMQANGATVAIISNVPQFTLANTADSSYTGFTVINPGITLRNTPSTGVTSSSDSSRFWGTATNSVLFNGQPSTDFVLSTSASFSGQVNFSDAGYTVGSPVKLTVSNVGNSVPTIKNSQQATATVFQTTLSNGNTVTPMQLLNNDVLPGADQTSNLGSLTAGANNTPLRWNNIYAINFQGTATQANTLNTNGNYIAASVANTPSSSTIVARDASGNINVSQMNGVATQAINLYDPLTATYVPAAVVSTASTIVARDASGAVTATSILNGGAANTGTIGTALKPFGTVYAQTFQGSFSGQTSTSAVNVVSASSTNAGGISSGSVLVNVSTNTMEAATFNASNGSAASPSITFINDNTTGFYYTTGGNINISCSGNATGNGYFSPGGNLTLTGKFIGTATSAQYADLAEKYLADQEYEAGTVVTVGGSAEVTASTQGDLAIGVVSTNPAYMMNSELVGGTYIALKGRVPVKVTGPVQKGQRLVAGNNGTAQAATDKSDVFAIALETNSNEDTKLVECVIL
jgi:hypothetical protein